MSLAPKQWCVRDGWSGALLGYVHNQRDIDTALSTARVVFRRHDITVDNAEPDPTFPRGGKIRYLTALEVWHLVLAGKLPRSRMTPAMYEELASAIVEKLETA